MTRRTKDGLVIIAAEEDGLCEFCGGKAELRPYGPNGEYVCFQCGMKDEEAAIRQFGRLLAGNDIERKVTA